MLIRHHFAVEEVSHESFLKLFYEFVFKKLRPWKNYLNAMATEDKETLRLISFVERGISEWEKLADATLQSEISTMTNAFAIFDEPLARQFLTKGDDKVKLDISSIITEGKIIVPTISAIQNPTLSGFLAKYLKARFYSMLHARDVKQNDKNRLVGIIMDEFQLGVTKSNSIMSDSKNLATIRSKKGFVIATTQGYASLESVIGDVETQLLFSNFNNLFIFRSKEQKILAMYPFQQEIEFPQTYGNKSTFADFNRIENMPSSCCYFQLANGVASRGIKLAKPLVSSMFLRCHIGELVQLVITKREDYLYDLLRSYKIEKASPAMWRDILKIPSAKKFEAVISLHLRECPRDFIIEILKLNPEFCNCLKNLFCFEITVDEWLDILEVNREAKPYIAQMREYFTKSQWFRYIAMDATNVEYAKNFKVFEMLWTEDWVELLSMTTNADEESKNCCVWSYFDMDTTIKLLLKAPERIAYVRSGSFRSADWRKLILGNPIFFKNYKVDSEYMHMLSPSDMNLVAQKYPDKVKDGTFEIIWSDLDSETLRVFENHLTKREKINAGLEGKTLKEIYHG